VARLPQLDEAAESAIVAEAKGEVTSREAAFGKLFRTLREPVLGLCLHVTGRRADAEDALQEVFLAVYRALPGFRGDARLTTWIYRIALRASIRAKARRPAGQAVVDPELPGNDAEAQMATREKARQLMTAMQKLSAEQRAVLSLFAIEGLSHREIALVLGVPEGTIWSRLHKARRRLAEEVEIAG
jgi:RNA polymerase sigma-70 factor, ECF subfamily